MNLTDAELAFLQSLHEEGITPQALSTDDASMMLALLRKTYPKGFNDPISYGGLGPNAICGHGATRYIFLPKSSTITGDCWLTYFVTENRWRLPSRKFLPPDVTPKTLLDAWQLMLKCGVDPFAPTVWDRPVLSQDWHQEVTGGDRAVNRPDD